MGWRYQWHGSGSDENGDALRKGAHIYFGREHVAWFGDHHQQASDLVLLLNEQQAPEQDGERWEQVNLDDLGRWGDDLRDSDTNLLFLPQAIDIAIAEITNLRREVAKLRGAISRFGITVCEPAACDPDGGQQAASVPDGWKPVPVVPTEELAISELNAGGGDRVKSFSEMIAELSPIMILCPTCGNKRCPHANDRNNTCTGSNEPGQPGSAYP